MTRLHIFSSTIFSVLLIIVPGTISYEPFITREPSVIIIGAGASGLAAASRLMDNGINNILVLEAEGRLGGRVNSVHFGDNKIDMGAEWVHGQQGNVVYEMVQEHKEIQLMPSNLTAVAYYSTGERIEEELGQEIMEFYDIVDNQDHYNLSHNLTGVSTADYVTEKYTSDLLERYKDDEKKLKICVDGLSLVESNCNSVDGCQDWHTMAIKNNYDACPGDQDLNWDGRGFGTVLNLLFYNIYPNYYMDLEKNFDKVYKNKEVTRIEWRNVNGTVKVHCSDGTLYSADHVIFTPSLGVLKHDYRTLFSPSLPLNNHRCISSLGFGTVMKIPMFFREKWWYGDFKSVQFIWRAEDKINLPLDFPKGPILREESWVSQIYTVTPAENNPNVLIAWITGLVVPELETTSYEIIQEGVMYALRKFLGKDYNITEPDNLTHTTWSSNPHFRGTYSYPTLESEAKDFNCQEVLAMTQWQNQRPVLLFAGEATSPRHFSTVHGAIETGYRAAEELLRYHNILLY